MAGLPIPMQNRHSGVNLGNLSAISVAWRALILQEKHNLLLWGG